MQNKELAERVKVAVKEAMELSEYWVGTINDGLVRQDANTLLDNITEENLTKLENTLDKVRNEAERSEDER